MQFSKKLIRIRMGTYLYENLSAYFCKIKWVLLSN